MQKLKPGFSEVIFITVFILALASGTQMLSLDSDIGRHITMGNIILNEQIIPTRDLLSHTLAGSPRPPYEWFSQVLFALSFRAIGLDGVILLTSLILSITFTLIYLFSLRRSNSPLIALALVFLLVGASSIHWLPRPHIFTFLFLAIWIENLDKLAQGKNINLRVFPFIMFLWANLHGGFIFGILAWIAYFAGWLWNLAQGKANRQTGKSLIAIGALSIFASFITPDLWRNWNAVLNNRSTFILNRTVETMRPHLSDPATLPFTFLLGISIFIIIINHRNMRADHIILLSGMGTMALLMARNIPLFAIACAPIISEMGAKKLSSNKVWLQIEKRFAGFGSATWNNAWAISITLLAILFFSWVNTNNKRAIYQFDPTIFPVEAMNFLQSNPQSGNMFNDFNWGGYLLYRLYPHYIVFIDSQSDFYGEDLLREYDETVQVKNRWESVLEKYDITWAIIPNNSSLEGALKNELQWHVLYQDATAIILRKP